MLILPRRYGQQKPPLGTQIQRGHSLAQRMIYCVLFNDGGGLKVVNLVSGAVGSVSTDAGRWRHGSRGAGLETYTTSDWLVDFGVIGASVLPTSGGFTAILAYRKTDATLRSGGGFGASSGANACGTLLPYGDGTVYWDYGGTGGGNRLSVGGLTMGDDVWAFTTGARGMEIWQNAVIRASNASDPSRTNAGTPFYLGYYPAGATPDLAVWGYFYAWARQLSKDEILRLYIEPYAMLSAPRRLWVDVAAAAGGQAPRSMRQFRTRRVA